MGIETVLLIVNENSLDEILDMPWNSVYESMEKAELRHLRPKQLMRLERVFDIDCEAEILDWMETIGAMDGTVRDVLLDIENGEEGLLQFMQFASPGAWQCWEARSYLYLDVALNRQIVDRDDLYSSTTWSELITNLANLPEDEFADKVCIDWMGKKKRPR